MADFLTLKEQVLDFFNDPDQSIYGDETIRLALRFALQEYSTHLPHLEEAVITLPQSGNEIELPLLTSMEGVRKVYYPWDVAKSIAEQEPNQVIRWDFDALSDKAILTLYTSAGVIPQAGKKLRLFLINQHTLAGLDEATVTTIPQAHISLILQGMVGHLLLYTASNRGDILDKSLCERLAQMRLAAFQHMLVALATERDRGQVIIPWQSRGYTQTIY